MKIGRRSGNIFGTIHRRGTVAVLGTTEGVGVRTRFGGEIGVGGGGSWQHRDDGSISEQCHAVVLLVIGPAHVDIPGAAEAREVARRSRNQQGAASGGTGFGAEAIQHAVAVGRRSHTSIGVSSAGRIEFGDQSTVSPHLDGGGRLGVDPGQNRIHSTRD